VFAIRLWLFAYVQWKFVDEFEKIISTTRLSVSNFLEGKVEDLHLDTPFSVFLNMDFEAIQPCLFQEHSHQLEEAFLTRWPENKLDLIGFASAISWFDVPELKKLFHEEKINDWLQEIAKKLESCFWESLDKRIQELCSDALEVISLYGIF
jgi:hypothetical protein